MELSTCYSLRMTNGSWGFQISQNIFLNFNILKYILNWLHLILCSWLRYFISFRWLFGLVLTKSSCISIILRHLSVAIFRNFSSSNKFWRSRFCCNNLSLTRLLAILIQVRKILVMICSILSNRWFTNASCRCSCFLFWSWGNSWWWLI